MSINKIKNILDRIDESARSCIVCDVQPMYEKYIDFNIGEFVEYLETKDDILYFYVGSENSGIGTDTKEDIMMYLVENGLSEDKLRDITFIDKGYGFFRGYMDETTLDDSDLIRIVKYLIDNDIWDTRDIEDEIVRNDLGLPEDVDDDEGLNLPSEFSIENCRGFEGSELVGGGADECLRELEIYFQAYDFSYIKNYKFIY